MHVVCARVDVVATKLGIILLPFFLPSTYFSPRMGLPTILNFCMPFYSNKTNFFLSISISSKQEKKFKSEGEAEVRRPQIFFFLVGSGRQSEHPPRCTHIFLLSSFHFLFSQKGFAYDFEFLHAFLSNKKIRFSPKKMGGTLPSPPKSSFLGGQQLEYKIVKTPYFG